MATEEWVTSADVDTPVKVKVDGKWVDGRIIAESRVTHTPQVETIRGVPVVTANEIDVISHWLKDPESGELTPVYEMEDVHEPENYDYTFIDGDGVETPMEGVRMIKTGEKIRTVQELTTVTTEASVEEFATIELYDDDHTQVIVTRDGDGPVWKRG